jgi:hypothetical protein
MDAIFASIRLSSGECRLSESCSRGHGDRQAIGRASVYRGYRNVTISTSTSDVATRYEPNRNQIQTLVPSKIRVRCHNPTLPHFTTYEMLKYGSASTMQKSLLFLIVTSISGLLSSFQEAQACPDGQYQRCVFGACACLPEIGGTPGQVFEKGKKELEGVVGGAGLEQWIIASHNTAINGSMPIPPEIRQALTGYASEDSMNRVRFKIGDSGFINLARVLEQGGYAQAVTLIDVVVFRGPSEASDPATWAHELTHVDQYQQWGVHSFAVQYAKDWQSVEDPAYAKGSNYWQWAQQNGVQQTDAGGNALPPPLPIVPQQGVGSFCYTQIGRFGPGPTLPLGAPCHVDAAQGVFWGQVGN